MKKFLLYVLSFVLILSVILFVRTFDPTPLTGQGVFNITPGPNGQFIFQRIVDNRTVPYVTFDGRIGYRIQFDNLIADTDFKDVAWAPDRNSFAFFQLDKGTKSPPQNVCVATLNVIWATVKCLPFESNLDYGQRVSIGKDFITYTIGNQSTECGKEAYSWNSTTDLSSSKYEAFTDVILSPNGKNAIMKDCQNMTIINVGEDNKNIQHISFPVGDTIWSPDSTKIIFTLPYPAGFEPGEGNKIGSYDITTQKITWIDVGDTIVSNLAVSPNGRVAFIAEPMWDYNGIRTISSDGTILFVGPQDWFVNSIVWLNDHQIVAKILNFNHVDRTKVYEVP